MFDVFFLQERYHNATLWNKHLPSLDDFVNTYLSGQGRIPNEYQYIVDGSKEKDMFLSRLYTFEEELDDSTDLPF